jgi:hypothetical protein
VIQRTSEGLAHAIAYGIARDELLAVGQKGADELIGGARVCGQVAFAEVSIGAL